MSELSALPMKAFVARQTAARLDRLAHETDRVRASAGEEAVHDLRVAIRRFVSCLRVFRSFFPRRKPKRILKRLKPVMRAAGNVRDRDVAKRLSVAAGLDSQSKFVASLAKRRKRAAKRLTRELNRKRLRTISRSWRKALRINAMSQKNGARTQWEPLRSVADNAAAQLPAMAEQFLSAGDAIVADKASGAKLHRFRIRAKRFRYVLELFQDCYGSELDSRIADLKKLQTILGDVNDTRAMGKGAKSDGSQDEPGATQLQDFLSSRQERKFAELERLWQTKFADPPQRKAWLETLSRTEK